MAAAWTRWAAINRKQGGYHCHRGPLAGQAFGTRHALDAEASSGQRGSSPAVISDLDIWRAAALMVKRHGNAAGLEAARRADELLAQGDTEGQAVWLRIVRAIQELQRTEPEGAVH
jgi:hypothetical protein